MMVVMMVVKMGVERWIFWWHCCDGVGDAKDGNDDCKMSPNFNFLLCWINEECPYWWRWRWFSKKWLLLQRMPVLKKCWWFQILWAPTAAIRKVWKSKQFPAEVCTGINIIIIAGEKMFLALMIVISWLRPLWIWPFWWLPWLGYNSTDVLEQCIVF